MAGFRLEDYVKDIEEIPDVSARTVRTVSTSTRIFSYIDKVANVAIPNDRYWKIWHSDNRRVLVCAGLIPRQFGSRWCVPVHLRSEGTRHISDVFREIGFGILGNVC